MKTMTVRGSPIFRNLLVAAAVVILGFGLKYSSDVLAPIFLAATLAILFTPILRWLEKKGLHTGLALVVMILGLGGLIFSLLSLVELGIWVCGSAVSNPGNTSRKNASTRSPGDAFPGCAPQRTGRQQYSDYDTSG
jgi:predicted PurR-regulated permease PerM